MLKESFHIDGWFPDESPDVSVGEHLMAMSTLRDCLDENLSLKKTLFVLGFLIATMSLLVMFQKNKKRR